MAAYQQGSSQDLLRSLTSFLGFPTPASGRALQKLLTQHRDELLNPLSKKAKSAEDRKKVTSKELEIANGAKRAFGDDFVDRVKLLSDSLDLNEIVCADLLWKAESSKSRWGHSSLLDIAEAIFFDERHSVLKSLQMLFTARQNAHNAGDAGLLIAQYTAGLLDSNLFDRLLDLLASLVTLEDKEQVALSTVSATHPPQSHPSTTANSKHLSPSSQWDHQRAERHMLAETVFIICYTTVVTHEQALKLLKVLQTFAIQICTIANANGPAKAVLTYHHGLSHTIFVLLSAMIVVLDVCNEHEVLDVRGDKGRPLLMHETQFIVDFNQQLAHADWQKAKMKEEDSQYTFYAAVQEVLKLAWASFLRQTIRTRRSDPQLNAALQLFREENIDMLLRNLTPAFVYLRHMVSSEFLQSEKMFQATYLEVMDELVRSFLTTSGLKAKEMKSDEENGMRAEAAYQQYKVGPRPPRVSREFDNFLLLLASIYRSQPSLASRFWNDDYPSLTHFVRSSGDNLFESNFVSYLKMLSSLSSGAACALHTFHFLSDRSRKYTNWDYFFDALHQYYLDFQEPQHDDLAYYDYSGRVPHASRLVRQISPEEVDSLEAILQVTQAVLKPNAHVRQAVLQHPHWRVLDALFHLLSCPVPVSLKASLTLTIHQFAQDPASHIYIWQFLDASQLIASHPSSTSSLLLKASDASDRTANNHSDRTGNASTAPNTPGPNAKQTSATGAGIVSGGGILFELSEIESKEEHYPYTLAFINLLNALLSNHYHDSRDTLADVNLWPYVQFIIKDVFQRFDQRAYKHEQEKWQIAKACLKFFLSLLRDSVDAFSFSEKVFNADGTPANGNEASQTRGQNSTDSVSMAAQLAIARYGTATLRLYRYFLSRTELLNKVIMILCGEGQADLLFASRERSKDSSLEDCVRYCLMILETVLLRQGPILASHLSNFSISEETILSGAGASGSSYASSSSSSAAANTATRKLRLLEDNTSILVPLHTILLRKMSDIATLALYVRYPFDHVIARLSVSIIHLLSRDTDKLALILHDQGVAADFVNGYIDKLELEDMPSRNSDQIHYRGILSTTGASQGNDGAFVGADATVDANGEEATDDDSSYWALRAPSIREAILALLLECATQPEYNLTQLLFGMNPSESSIIGHSSYSFNRQLESRHVKNANNASGRGGSKVSADAAPLSVLPTLVSLLRESSLSASHPKLCSLMYELLYNLLSRPSEFGGVCRSLRSSEFFRHQFEILDVSLSSASVAHQIIYASEQQALLLPSQKNSASVMVENDTFSNISDPVGILALQQLEQELYGPLMEQRAWLLKSIALELHTTCGTNRIYATHLLEALFTSSADFDLLTGNTGPSAVDNPGRKRLTSGVAGEKLSSRGGASGGDASGNGGVDGHGGAGGTGGRQQQRMSMRELLDALEIPLVEPLPILQGSIYFNNQRLQGEGGASVGLNGSENSSHLYNGSSPIDMKSCTELDSKGFSFVDVRLLYGQLVAVESDIRSVYTLAPEQSNDLIAEQAVILRRAVAWNRFQEVLKSQHKILESWRQVLEISLIECYHLLEVNSKEIVLYELLETLLTRLNHPELRLQVGPPLTSCILMLTAKIRQLTFPVRVSKLKSIEDMVESSAGNADSDGSYPSQDARRLKNGRPSQLTEEILSTSSPSYLPVEQLLVILKEISASLLRQGTTLTMRSNLYGSLLNYLQFTQRSSAEVILISSSHSFSDFWASDDDHDPISASLSQQQHQQRRLYLGTLRQLHNVAERLMEVISSDATDAPHIFQSIAFATLDALCTYECGLYGMGVVGTAFMTGLGDAATVSAASASLSSSVGAKWITYLKRQGLLRFFLESLVQQDDAVLSDLLLPSADSLNDLYVFESKMAMLLSMASTPTGAISLVEANLMPQLVKFSCIDHPHQAFAAEISSTSGKGFGMQQAQENWIKPVHERYESILLSVLRLVASVMTQLPRNVDVASQVIDFIEAHTELVMVLLKDMSPGMPRPSSLQLLSLLASIFYHLSFHDVLMSTRLATQASKYYHLLSQLYAKFVDALKSDFDRSSGNRTYFFSPPPPPSSATSSTLSSLSGLGANALNSGATGNPTSSTLPSLLATALGGGTVLGAGNGASSTPSSTWSATTNSAAFGTSAAIFSDPIQYEQLQFQHHQRAVRHEILHLLRNLSGTLRRLAISSAAPTSQNALSTTTREGLATLDVSGSSAKDANGKTSPTSSNGAPGAIVPNGSSSYGGNVVNLEIALQRAGKLLFAPSMASSVPGGPSGNGSTLRAKRAQAAGNGSATPGVIGTSGRELPALSILVTSVMSSLALLEAIKEEAVLIIKKLQSVHQLKSEEMITTIRNAAFFGSSIFGLDTDIDSLSVDKSTSLQLQQAVQHILGTRIADQRSRSSILYQLIENDLFLLWRHLSFFLLEDELSSPSYSALLLFMGSSKSSKIDKAALQKDALASLNPLFSRLELLPPLSYHQTHIIPVMVQKIKDVLEDF